MTLDLDALREGWNFEAKLAGGRDGRGALPESFWETYSGQGFPQSFTQSFPQSSDQSSSFKLQQAYRTAAGDRETS